MAVPTAAMDGLAISKTKELKGTEKRDKLVSWEKQCQAKWAEEKVFESNPPSIDEIPLDAMSSEELREKHPKFFGCMAYPYMNGNLHAGHAFSISKVEFTGMVASMQGKRALTPLGFHVSGMPIKACADKLVNEIRMFGKDFSGYNPEAESETAPAPAAAPRVKEDITKFSTKKSKSVAKTAKMKYQFQIMAASGVPLQEVHKFADVNHWLEFFPPIARRDLTAFGSRADWRRSFVTTTANPYYDSMVRWQMTRLKELGKIKFGNRYTIYSIKDGQPCLDHDRQSGEGINSQEYTGLKMRVVEWAPKAQEALKDKLPTDAKVFLVAATLRPETMYGQTNCFVGPEITYGVFKASPTDYYVVTERAAKNMAYQGLFEKNGEVVKVADLPGPAIIGTLIDAPLSQYGQVYVLPMATVKEGKGTGVVTSVPSDSPDDYINVMDLKKKPEFYGIKAEWIDKDIIPVIETPAYGKACAETLCKQMKISSPKDTVQLEKAKELAYKAGFYNGTMIVGEFAGDKVEEAKPKVREQMIRAGDAFVYAEPEGKVMSRSGDECIVALMDQWFLDYGEEAWRDQALEWVENKDGKGINTYSSEAKNQFQAVLGWLNAWAVSRSFGLGSRLPWDESQLVESLSDSTIYMAYYTLVPFLHKDIFGKETTEYNIKPEQMTMNVWDYVFCRTEWSDEVEKTSSIPRKTLESMRRSFQYYYPLDMRASGKDLIGNHLTFFIYNHIALFPQEYWPKGIRTNGHLMVNSEKMSKSTGNFMTLHDLVGKYGADASRIALADAGDGIGDANFEEDVADNNILRLYNCREWCEEIVKTKQENKDAFRSGKLNDFQDKLFNNDINAIGREILHFYDQTNYKLALKCIYEFFNARDFYREACTAAGIPLHLDLVERWIRNLALLMNPLAPHFAEFLWIEILKESGSIQTQRFPDLSEADASLTAAREYIKNISSAVNSAESAQLKKKAKGKEVSFDPSKPKKLTIFINTKFPEWQQKYVDLLSEMWDPATRSLDEKALMGRVSKMGEMKKAMPFTQTIKKRLQAGEDALNRTLLFDEADILVKTIPSLKRSAGLKEVDIVRVLEGGKKGERVTDGAEVDIGVPSAENAVPGNPSYNFENVEA
ncbi:Leucine--tRNA ligase, cytoplasmic [Ceratocystis lukuohia]|uniref:leucine--tRNA ligase n=1 Tax=Ceratocystis lukuohia TaxID=2019550 RepID=A0ABR4MF77_9PEZI